MIQITDIYSLIGVDGCEDVATSLTRQGCVEGVAIPLYNEYYLNILYKDDCKYVSTSMKEFMAIKNLISHCGAVTMTVNLFQAGALTLIGILAVRTPNTGMHIFVRDCKVDVNMIDRATSLDILELAGEENIGLEEAIQVLYDRLVINIDNSCRENGILVHDWRELSYVYNNIIESGDMQMMYTYRFETGASVI